MSIALAPRRATLARRLASVPAALRAWPRRFRHEARGSISIETLLIVPILFWALVGSVVFFDGFRTRTQSQMAAQTVSDLLSRRTEMFTAAYLEGMNDVFDFLAATRYPTRLRISSVIWDSANERNRLQWSYGTRGLPPLPVDTFEFLQNNDHEGLISAFGEDDTFSFLGARAAAPRADLADRIPPVLPGEALILVESFALWSPFFNVGVGQVRFAPIVVTRPRFTPWVNMEGVGEIPPEADYEVEFIGYIPGNESLPDPNTPPEPPPPSSNVVVQQNFNSGGTTGWSASTITPNGSVGSFLGPFGGTTFASPVTFSANLGSGPVASTRVEFDLLILDSWDGYNPSYSHPEGDHLALLINGTSIATQVFRAEGETFTANSRRGQAYLGGSLYEVTMVRTRSGDSFYGTHHHDQIWRVVINIQAPPLTFTLGLSARLDEAIGSEAFGIDNFSITNTPGTPVPVAFTPNQATYQGLDPYTRFPLHTGCPEFRVPANWLTVRNTNLSSTLSFRRILRTYTQQVSGCGIPSAVGYAIASPTFVFDYDNEGRTGAGNQLRIEANDGGDGFTCDPTMIIRDPSGQWWFNDDINVNNNRNPRLNLGNAPTGLYQVWVGSWLTNQNCPINVNISRY